MPACQPPYGEGEIKLGVSTCLLGEPVRYDGGHKRDRYLTGVLAKFFTFVPVCPEFECGLGVPREAVRLVGDPARPRLVGNKTGTDHTRRMQTWITRRLADLRRESLSGFIFKSKSPSSGMERIPIYNEKGMPVHRGSGLFAGAFMQRFPDLPVEEEGRLHDPHLREHFLERVFAYHRLHQLLKRPFARRHWVEFHARHKLQLSVHSPKHHQDLGRLVAGIATTPVSAFKARYREIFLAALAVRTTPRRHANTLQHMLGYLRPHLDGEARRDLLETVHRYRDGELPLVVPMSLFAHYLRRFRVEYLCSQTYLQPHPRELMLRNAP